MKLSIIFYVVVTFLFIISPLAFPQSTTHNEIHKAYQSSVNKLGDCRGEDVKITRKGSLSSSSVANQSSTVTQPSYDVVCDRPDRELVYAMNVHGQRLWNSNILYHADFDTNRYKGEQDWVGDTYKYYDYAFSRQMIIPWGAGKYEYVMHTFDKQNCSDWSYAVNETAVSAEGKEFDRQIFRVIFDSDDGKAVVNYTPRDSCRLHLYAIELWKINNV